jgi:hypothetical protein
VRILKKLDHANFASVHFERLKMMAVAVHLVLRRRRDVVLGAGGTPPTKMFGRN